MTVEQFKNQVEAFLGALTEHRDLWAQSVDSIFPRNPTANRNRLQEQSRALSRHLGRIREHIELFEPRWLMRTGAGAGGWDALNAAVSADEAAIIKGPAMRHVLDRLNQLVGQLEVRDPDEELMPRAPAQAAPLPAPQGDERDVLVPIPDDAPNAPEPLNFDKTSVRGLMRAIGNLSLGAFLTVLGILAALITATAEITRWTNARSIEALQDSVARHQRTIDSLRDSATAQERRVERLQAQRDSLDTILKSRTR